jgi:hypothetical protein
MHGATIKIPSHILIKDPDIKCNENLSCGSQAVPYKWAAGQT